MKLGFFILLYSFAFTFHGLLWLHFWLEGDQKAQAVITMGFGLLLLWGGFGGLVQRHILKRVSPMPLSSSWKNTVILFGSLIGMALLAEVVSTSMTNTAPLWGFSPREVYITASPNYFEVVFRHSVIVFLPQLFVVAWLHQRWAFKPWHWFILYGFVGYLNEWLAFGEAASVFSIPFWIIIYGSIVYLPTYFFMPVHHRQPLRWYRVLLAVMLPFVVAIPWALVVITWLHQ